MNIIRKPFHLLLFTLAILFLSACETDRSLEKTEINCTKYEDLPEDKDFQKSVLTAYSLYREDFKQKNYTEALKNLKKVMDIAPCFRKTTFRNGEVIYQYLIDHVSNPLEQQTYSDEFDHMMKLWVCCFGE